jgi:hypothetical protein
MTMATTEANAIIMPAIFKTLFSSHAKFPALLPVVWFQKLGILDASKGIPLSADELSM